MVSQARPSLVPTTVDSVLVEAPARTFHCKWMLDEGQYTSMRELAEEEEEELKPSYAAGVLRRALLASGIVDATINGQPIRGLMLDLLLKSYPLSWSDHSGISHGNRWSKGDSAPIGA